MHIASTCLDTFPSPRPVAEARPLAKTGPLAKAGPLTEGGPLTAAAARDLVATWRDLTEVRRRDLLSAINCVVRVTGLPADCVLLTPAALRPSFLERSASACGISKGTKANIVSLLRDLLGRAGVIDDSVYPLTDAWTAALSRLSSYQRHGVTRLARFCSGRQLDPADVTEQVLLDWEGQMQSGSLVGHPRELVATARGVMKKAAQTIPGWRGPALSRRSRQHDYILPLKSFSDAFRVDLARFGDHLAATTLDDPFGQSTSKATYAQSAPPRPLQPSTIRMRQDHCRWAASAVVAAGEDIAEITSVASLVAPLSRARNALQFLYKRAGDKPSPAGSHVAQVLLIIARHVARLEPGDVKKLSAWKNAVHKVYRGMTPKNTARMREAMEPRCEAALLMLPDAFMSSARKLHASAPDRAASLALRGVAVAFLSCLPIRLANLTNLRLDQHMHRPDPRRARIGAISIPAEETKTGKAIDLPVSPELSNLLHEWITVFRPTIAPPGCNYLFPGHTGQDRPITRQAFREAIAQATHDHAGVRLTPHQFRHLAAHRYLDANPGHFEVVRQFLGHASIDTTIRHYAGTNQAAAVRQLNEVIVGRRRLGRQPQATTARGGRPPRGSSVKRKGGRHAGP